MMRPLIIFVALLVFLSCSCAKQPRKEPVVGVARSVIPFGAAAGYLNGEETRTVYSGEPYSVTESDASITGSGNPLTNAMPVRPVKES